MQETNTIIGTLVSIRDNGINVNNSATPIIVSINEFLKPVARSITLSAGSIEEVIKNSPGWVIATNSGILNDVKILDGNVEVWVDEDYNAPQPFYCETSIKLKSATGGVVNIIFL